MTTFEKSRILLKSHKTVWNPTVFAEHFRMMIEAEPLGPREALEIGVGTGILAIAAGQCGFRVTGTDLNPDAGPLSISNWALNGLPAHRYEFLQSNLFDHPSLRKRSFDLIWFNAPTFPFVPEISDRLPARDRFEVAENGGRSLLDQFLTHAGVHLAPNGKIFTVSTSRQNWPQTIKLLNHTWERWRIRHKITIPLAEHYLPFISYWTGLAKKDGVERIFRIDDAWHHDVYFIECSAPTGKTVGKI